MSHDDVQFVSNDGYENERVEEREPARSFESRRDSRPAKALTQLDRLRSLMAKAVAIEPCNVPVPLRPGLSLDIEVESLTIDRMEQYQKQCTKKATGNRRQRRSNANEGSIDTLQLASLVLHNHCVAIRVGDEIVTDDNGANLALTDREFLDMLNVVVTDDVSTVMAEIFGMEIHVMNAFMEVQEYIEETSDDQYGDESPLDK